MQLNIEELEEDVEFFRNLTFTLEDHFQYLLIELKNELECSSNQEKKNQLIEMLNMMEYRTGVLSLNIDIIKAIKRRYL